MARETGFVHGVGNVVSSRNILCYRIGLFVAFTTPSHASSFMVSEGVLSGRHRRLYVGIMADQTVLLPLDVVSDVRALENRNDCC